MFMRRRVYGRFESAIQVCLLAALSLAAPAGLGIRLLPEDEPTPPEDGA